MRRAVFAAALAAALASPALAAGALTPPQESALNAYLNALKSKRYDAAFALLARGQQSYFRNARNFASTFTADQLTVHSYKIVDVPQAQGGNAVARVVENVTILDPAHQALVRANLPVLYGVLSEGGSYRINDRFRPWKSYAPTDAGATKDRFTVTVRKVSYYKDRLEMIVTFANTGDDLVTVFPYGRSGLHDEQQRPYALVDSTSAARLDNELFLGLRLPTGAQYTGIVAFALPPDAATAKELDLTIAPIVREGADQPAAISLPPIHLP